MEKKITVTNEPSLFEMKGIYNVRVDGATEKCFYDKDAAIGYADMLKRKLELPTVAPEVIYEVTAVLPEPVSELDLQEG